MTHARWKLGAAGSLLLLATACGTAVPGQPLSVPTAVPAGRAPSPGPAGLPAPVSTPPGAILPAPVDTSVAGQPIPPSRASPRPPVALPTRPIVLQPKSPPAVVGQPYPFTLYTHCGVDFDLDFAGAFWDYSSGPVDRAVLGNPSQAGTMTLLDADQARFDYAGGSIRFRRHQGPKTIPGFCV